MKKYVITLAMAALFLVIIRVETVSAQEIENQVTKQMEVLQTAEQQEEVATGSAVTGMVVSGSAVGENEVSGGTVLEETVSDTTISVVPAESTDTQTEKDVAEEKKEKKEKKESKKADEKAKKEKKEKNYTNSELKLLACLIYAEAGNQSYKGKLAVANVVLNRVKSDQFPDTLKEVIYQKTYSRTYGRTIYQFSVAYPSVGTLKKALDNYGKRTNKLEIEAEQECIKVAKAALEGQSAIDDKDYLFFCRYSQSLASRKPNGKKIGAHYFYR